MEEKRRHSPIPLAHAYWKEYAQKGTWALDATCGNGKDTHALAKLFDGVISLDLQKEAIERAQAHCLDPNIFYFIQSHEEFPPLAHEKPISLIVYNLGYLPGGNKSLTTLTKTTLASLQKAMELLIRGGLISITCYPGHAEGAREEEALLALAEQLDTKEWTVCHHRWLNRYRAPSLLLLQKSL